MGAYFMCTPITKHEFNNYMSKENNKPKHPMQPPVVAQDGVVRFKQNNIVDQLLKHGQSTGMDLNRISTMNFSREDHRQFAQLLGYSVSGYSDLSYADPLDYEVVMKIHEDGMDVKDARIEVLEEQLESLKTAVRDAAVALFNIHPSDLG